MTLVILFVFGAIVGSFLNVVGLRWGKSILGRSHCPHCGKKLTWSELIPIVSFFYLRAKCMECKGKISWQYPLVEIWAGLVFITVPYFLIPVFCIYVVITIYDARHKIIPDALVYSSILLAVASRFIYRGDLIDWLAGPILFAFFGSIWWFSGGRAMGFGDAKLGLSIGLALGAAIGFSAIVLAFWIGAVFAISLIILAKLDFLKEGKGLTMKSEIPFAPFMIVGAWIALIFQLNILHVASI